MCADYARIKARIEEGEAKRNKRSNLESLLNQKISSVRYPMQELELIYPTTKGKVFSEEEDRYLLCRLNHYGMAAEDVYERIKKDIMEFPVFRFDWFFKSRSPQELQRRCNTLLGMIEKESEAEAKAAEEAKPKTSASRGKVRRCPHVSDRVLIDGDRNARPMKRKRRKPRRLLRRPGRQRRRRHEPLRHVLSLREVLVSCSVPYTSFLLLCRSYV
jgi:SWI/SNF-related matrix-associated actin-dependent regulator of chromatin subfamily A member 5